MPSDQSHALPPRPSAEHLRKQAKRLAKDDNLPLATAQRRLAQQYGAKTWADLMREVQALRGEEAAPALSPLAAAAKAGDVMRVSELLSEGVSPEGSDEGTTPLWQACASSAPDAARLAIAEALLVAGANPRRDDPGETALHAAALRGPLALVELLIRHNALEWQRDRKHRSALDSAKRGHAADKEAIVHLLHRPVIDDPSFRAAVDALYAGDAVTFANLLDAEPRLLRERILEPQCYRDASRHQYFRDPKLFWFIANNPTLVPTLPANIVAMTQLMLDRGVAQEDLNYALELAMTGVVEQMNGQRDALVLLLRRAGAVASPNAIEMTLGHRIVEPVLALLEGGMAMTASIAAALGRVDDLARLLPTASAEERQKALGLAVINEQVETARLALEAGADASAWLPVHRHSTPLHQAAIDENLPLMELLVRHGARTDIKDTLWSSTPWGWAAHQNKAKAKAWLEALAKSSG